MFDVVTVILNHVSHETSSTETCEFSSPLTPSIASQDRVHYRTGQQIVVVTAGSGVFYVDRELASLTKHRY